MNTVLAATTSTGLVPEAFHPDQQWWFWPLVVIIGLGGLLTLGGFVADRGGTAGIAGIVMLAGIATMVCITGANAQAARDHNVAAVQDALADRYRLEVDARQATVLFGEKLFAPEPESDRPSTLTVRDADGTLIQLDVAWFDGELHLLRDDTQLDLSEAP